MIKFKEFLNEKNKKTSVQGKYYTDDVQAMVNWVESQKEWLTTMTEPDSDTFEFIFKTPKAALNKVKSIRKKFDDIIREHGNDGSILTVELNTKEVLMRKKQEDKKLQDADYIVYHNSYSAATSEIENFANKRGYVLDDATDSENIGTQMFDIVGTGPSKPKPGKTNKFDFELYKGSTKQDEYLHASIYNRETMGNEFELTMYIS